MKAQIEPIYIQPLDCQQSYQGYIMGKDSLSINGAGKAKYPHTK